MEVFRHVKADGKTDRDEEACDNILHSVGGVAEHNLEEAACKEMVDASSRLEFAHMAEVLNMVLGHEGGTHTGDECLLEGYDSICNAWWQEEE